MTTKREKDGKNNKCVKDQTIKSNEHNKGCNYIKILGSLLFTKYKWVDKG